MIQNILVEFQAFLNNSKTKRLMINSNNTPKVLYSCIAKVIQVFYVLYGCV